jgi:hypothetical protein
MQTVHRIDKFRNNEVMKNKIRQIAENLLDPKTS